MLHSKAVLSADGTATHSLKLHSERTCVEINLSKLLNVTKLKSSERTCGGSAQDHWMSPGNTEVPDSVPVAHVLFDLLAQTLGHGVGSQAGYNLAGTNAGLCTMCECVFVREVFQSQRSKFQDRRQHCSGSGLENVTWYLAGGGFTGRLQPLGQLTGAVAGCEVQGAKMLLSMANG